MRKANVCYNNELAGHLTESADGYIFQYDPAFLNKNIPISVSLPPRKEGGIRLTPAYDIVCSRLAIPGEQGESAITINGKNDRLSRADFDRLAEYLHAPIRVRYEKFDGKFAIINKLIRASHLNKADQDGFLDIIQERLRRLELSE